MRQPRFHGVLLRGTVLAVNKQAWSVEAGRHSKTLGSDSERVSRSKQKQHEHLGTYVETYRIAHDEGCLSEEEEDLQSSAANHVSFAFESPS